MTDPALGSDDVNGDDAETVETDVEQDTTESPEADR